MKSTPTHEFGKTATLVVALAVVLSVLGPVGTVAAQEVSVTQSTTSTTAAPGETVTLQTTISVTDANAPGLQVQLPEGWLGNITDPDGGAPKPQDGEANLLEVVWLNEGTYTVTYAVHVPEDATAGDYTVDVEGSAIDPADDNQIVDTTQTTITVEEPVSNQEPSADAGDDQTVDEGSSVQLDATGSSDPDGDTLSYQWTQTAGTLVTLSDGTSATPSFTAPEVDANETLSFELEVSDGNGGTDTDLVNVTVEDVPEQTSPETDVSLTPESAEIVSGDSEDFDIDVESADGGVGAFEVTVSVSDASVANITDVTVPHDPDLLDVEYAEDNSSVVISAALGDTDDTGTISIATVTVTGASEGTTDLSLDVSGLGTEAGQSYNVTGTDGASVAVVELGPVGEFSEPPNDPDDDGKYEDVNGDENFDIVDVQALFANRNDQTIQDNPGKFDFNGDGKFDIVDVQALFFELITS